MSHQLEQDEHSFVVFRIGDEEYAVEIERVQGIIRYETPTPVPRSPDVVQGVINMRGRVIPVVDLSRRLSGVGFTPTETSRIVVADGAAGTLGLAVDEANEVASIPASDIQPAPEGALSADTIGAFSGVVEREGRLVIVLDLDEAVPKTEYAQASSEKVAQEGEADV